MHAFFAFSSSCSKLAGMQAQAVGLWRFRDWLAQAQTFSCS